MENENKVDTVQSVDAESQHERGYIEMVIQRYKNERLTRDLDNIAIEVPIALLFNGISHAVMLATPLNLIDFALGFSFSEGIISQLSDVYDIDECAHPDLGIELQITISSSCFARLKEHRRTLVGRTGCGLCGVDSLGAFMHLNQPSLGQLPTVKLLSSQKPFSISQDALFKAFDQLKEMQPINALTGSMHAAAWVDVQGNCVLVREDLGRHNALDKLIGCVMKNRDIDRHGCVIMTSRASVELAQKAAKAGIPLLATISAPTSMAIQHATQHDLTLVGFVRQDRLVVYSHAERLRID